jgi:hypothetical protein
MRNFFLSFTACFKSEGNDPLDILDIIEAEKQYGISFPRRYNGIIPDQQTLSVSVMYQNVEEGNISCPPVIDGSQFDSDQRQHIQHLLDVVRGWVPKSDVEALCGHYKIEESDFLVVLPREFS